MKWLPKLMLDSAYKISKLRGANHYATTKDRCPKNCHKNYTFFNVPQLFGKLFQRSVHLHRAGLQLFEFFLFFLHFGYLRKFWQKIVNGWKLLLNVVT